jgi:diacylglycerol O-acyltransferase / wax synthase
MADDTLTALDATFLELEEADQGAHMHIGAVMVFERRPDGSAPSTAALIEHLESRLDALPRFRQRLSSPTTGGLAWPRWEADERFKVATHVQRVRLPAPAGEAELLEWAGEFFSERLDRTRPLWEMAIIDGLAGGRWALATKTHHCMVDGVGSVDIGHVILDGEPVPDAEQDHDPDATASPVLKEVGPNGVSSLWSVPRRLGGLPLKLGAAGLGLARRSAGAARHPARMRDAMRRSRAMVDLLIRDEVVAAPRTSLNVPIGGKRRLAVARVPLASLKGIRAELGGTVNDVVLTAAAGGLRRLLLTRGEAPPHDGLRAMVPVNLREAAEQLSLGNRITSLFVRLPVAERRPLKRYARQIREAESLKSGSQALGSRALIDLAGHAPPLIHTFLARSLFATRLFNVTITNVPGPQAPLYAFGSRLTDVWPLVPLAAEHAVALAVFSYDGQVFFALNADRDAVPDLDVLAEGIEAELAELLQFTDARRLARTARTA